MEKNYKVFLLEIYEKYYDGKIKEFHEMKLGQSTRDGYETNFLEMLTYVPYIKDGKLKIQCFLSGIS